MSPAESRRRVVMGGLAVAFAGFARAEILEPWERLRRGAMAILVRHAETEPGGGDPPGYRLGDCATQRNLSAAGREHARRLGERFRAERVPIARVYSSPWCRCRDTAMLAFGSAQDWEPLASVFDFPDREPDYSTRVRKRIAQLGRKDGGNVVMVTHAVNIAAIAGVSVEPAEMVLMRPQGCCSARRVERLKL